MHLNPYIFIFFHHDEIILWDYKRHQQFAINKDYANRLTEFVEEPIFQPDNLIDQEFLKEGILVENLPEISKWEWDIISQIYHIGTQDAPIAHSIDNFDHFIEEYVQFCEAHADNVAEIHTEKEGPIFNLPTPNLDYLNNTTLLTALTERMTSRFFYQESLSMEEVSNLLYATFGEIHGPWKDLESLGLRVLSKRKSSPSAGGLHASEAYILAMNVTGLPSGVYHYRSHQHVLSLVSSEFNTSQLGRLLGGQKFAETMPLGIFITSRFDKLWDKYQHSRAYRLSLLDIGHLSQTFQLCTTAMGLESWLTGVFLDAEVNQLLKIENTSEQVMFFVGAGKGKRSFLDEKTLNFIKRKK